MSKLHEQETEDPESMDRLSKIKPGIVILVMCFAFSSWIDLLGVSVEFPILVHLLPERWRFPSYVLVIIQCAFISPVLYSVFNKACPGNTQRREVFMAYFIMSVGFTALLMLAIFWQDTVYFAGADRSLAALVLIFLLSMVDTTSCIVYLPYMSRFKEQYIPAYIAGEQSGGLIAGLVGLVQGAGGEAICNNVTLERYNAKLGLNYTEHTIQITHKEPRFSVSVFFIFLMGIMALSAIAFTILNFSKFARKEMVGKFALNATKEINEKELGLMNGNMALMADENNQDCKHTEALEDHQEPVMERWRLILFCATLMWCAYIMFGLFPTLQSFSTLPYGSLTYMLEVRLICIMNPLAALLALFVRMKSLWKLLGMVSLSSILVGYHIVLATMSPEPPLKYSTVGSFIAISSAVILATSNAYARACITTLLRAEGGHRALLLGGGSVQCGAFFGGITGFLLVNVFELFENENPCSNL